MTTIAEIRKTITSILQEYTHLSCYLFGSYAKNSANEQSDVDILLLFDKEKYEYKQILHLKATIKSAFENIGIYCDPIYGYIQNINDDKTVLYRQYIGYGIHIFGNNLQDIMVKETKEEKRQIEYEKYWRAMMFDKIRTLEYFVEVNLDIDESSLSWEFLYLVVYWNAKAELTLLDKQHSLNEFSLHFIYTELLQKECDKEVLHTLEILQIYKDKIRNDDYFDIEFESFTEHFKVVKDLILQQNNESFHTTLRRKI